MPQDQSANCPVIEATVRVHEVRYAALQQRAWAVVAVAGDEASAWALGPATSEADAFGDGRCVFAAAATFEAPRDSDVTVTILSGAGAREDAATVGAVRFSTADGRDAWRPLDDGEGALRCAACVEGDVAAADPARLGAEADAAREPARRANEARPGASASDLAWAGLSAEARPEAYAAAAGTLEPYATVEPAAAALEALLRDAALRRALTPTSAVLKRRTDVDRIVVRLVATLPVDQTEHGETIRTVVEPLVRSVVDDDAALALSRALVGGPTFLGLALAFAPAHTRRRVLDVAVCVGPAGLAALADAGPAGDLRAAAAALAAAHDADALLAAGLRNYRAARPPTPPDAEPGPALGADSDSDTDSDDAEPGRGLSREDSIDRLVSRTASYFTAPWSRAMASWRVEYRRAGRRGQAGVQVRAQHERRVARGARGAARARGVSARGAAVGRADAAEPDVHAAEPRGKDAVRAAPPQPGRRARAAVDPAARGVVAGRDAADASPGATAVVVGGRARRGVPGARRAHRARGPPGRRARGRRG